VHDGVIEFARYRAYAVTGCSRSLPHPFAARDGCGSPVALAALVGTALACRAPAEPSTTAHRLETLRRVDDLSLALTTRSRAAIVAASYGTLFGRPSALALAELESADLESWFRAASLTGYDTAGETFVEHMSRIHGELEHRGAASDVIHKKMFEGYVQVRMLDEARALARQQPHLGVEVLPEVRDTGALVPGRPSLWVVDPDKRQLQRQSIDLHQPAQVVMVSLPDCHFSQNAMRALESDPVLGPVLATHALRLAPQAAQIDFDVLQQWNREHPTQAIALAVRSDEWPLVDSWNTPTFYFLKNGTLVAKVEGWPPGGRRAEVVAGLQQIGLLPVR